MAEATTVYPLLLKHRTWWINVGLFVLTLLTSTAFGSALTESFFQSRSLTTLDLLDGYGRLLHFNHDLWAGLIFSVPLLLILLAHEAGHYLECNRRQVDATLPYFLPSPSIFGTLGAFIRIRSPIFSREGLFDIGVKGPLAGFVALMPFLLIGVSFSKVVPRSPGADAICFGTPLVLRILEYVRFGNVPTNHILLHPMAMAAWAGLFATALNLLPLGQLDGGHLVYALGSERWHRRISLAFVGMLAVAGIFYWPWWLWGGAMFLFGRRHPLVYDSTPLSVRRMRLCVLAWVIFVISACIVPLRSL